MTKKEFHAKCKEILASTHLTERGKAREIEDAATGLIEDIINEFPEIQSVEERCTTIEEKHTGRKGFITYCPECSTWAPKEPPAIEALSQEWSKIKDRKIEELCRKVLSGNAA